MRNKGFTLIELLVVIAVIAMLLGLLLPALRSARMQTRAVICGANLKQLYFALSTYDQENKTFPHGFDDAAHGATAPPGGYVGSPIYDKMGWWWFHSVNASLGKDFRQDGIICCPSKRIQDARLISNYLCGNYGVNNSVCKDSPGITGIIGSEFVGDPLGSTQIRNPAGTLLLCDSGYALISWRGACDAGPPYFDNPLRQKVFYLPGLSINAQRVKDNTILSGCEEDAVRGRHPNKTINAVFADGHVTRPAADELFVQEAAGEYLNRSPLWVPK